jgi:uncharacterized Zn-binding protein involved in type VI secretion
MPAARMGDNVLQNGPHCHAPIHPPAPTPTPLPHPPMPLTIVKGEPTVLIGKKPAARVTDMTAPCSIIPCIPAGPGMIMQGSATVMIGKMPAARVTDSTLHASCVAPIPGPKGMIIPAGEPTVLIGGPTFSMSLLDAIVAWVKAEFKFTDLALASAADAMAADNADDGEAPGAAGAGSNFGGRPPGGRWERLMMNVHKLEGKPLTDREQFLDATSNMKISSAYSGTDRDKVEADLQKVYNTPDGKQTIDDINNSGKPVLIAPPKGYPDKSNGNSCGGGYDGSSKDPKNMDAYPPPQGTGKGSGSVIGYDPNKDDIAGGKTDPNDPVDGWRKRPPGVGLSHELIHADHNANGTNADKQPEQQDDSLISPKDGTPMTENPEELKTAGVPPHQNDPGPNENKVREQWCSFNPDDCKGYPHDGNGLAQRNSYNGTGADFKKDPNASANPPPTPTPLPGDAGKSDLPGGGGTGIG